MCNYLPREETIEETICHQLNYNAKVQHWNPKQPLICTWVKYFRQSYWDNLFCINVCVLNITVDQSKFGNIGLVLKCERVAFLQHSDHKTMDTRILFVNSTYVGPTELTFSNLSKHLKLLLLIYSTMPQGQCNHYETYKT